MVVMMMGAWNSFFFSSSGVLDICMIGERYEGSGTEQVGTQRTVVWGKAFGGGGLANGKTSRSIDILHIERTFFSRLPSFVAFGEGHIGRKGVHVLANLTDIECLVDGQHCFMCKTSFAAWTGMYFNTASFHVPILGRGTFECSSYAHARIGSTGLSSFPSDVVNDPD